MHNKKGIMLITVLIISALLFIFFLASISAISGSNKNASTSLEREKAMTAVKAGMQAALEEINKTAANQTDFNLSFSINDGNPSTWKSVTDTLENKLFYRYAYKNGVAVVEGKYQIDKKQSINRFVRVSYAIEAMGVIANNINANISVTAPITAHTTNNNKAVISSVYSYQTQLPFDAWIGTANLDKDKIYYKGSILNKNASEIIYNYQSIINNHKKAEILGKGLVLQNAEWENNRRHDSKTFKWQKDFVNWSDEVKDKIGVAPSQFIDFNSYEGSQNNPVNDRDVLIDKNVWFLPYGQTVYCNSDLRLSNNALLVVSGNLVVRGNIRGNGIVFVMNQLYFVPKNTSDYGGDFSEKIDETDQLIVYAVNDIKVINPIVPTFHIDPAVFASLEPNLLVRLSIFADQQNINISGMNLREFISLAEDYYNAHKATTPRDELVIWYEKWMRTYL